MSVIDGAQSAGACDIDLGVLGPDIFCFTGHKSLFGPPGTGGLYIKDGLSLTPLIFGGTGSRSEDEQQPEFMPDRYESGTPNTSGIAGLKAGLEFIEEVGLDTVIAHEEELTDIIHCGLKKIPGLSIVGQRPDDMQLPLTSFTIADRTPSEIGHRLDREFGIMVRVGLHCAPRAHKSVNTFPQGTVRLAPGYFNTPTEMDETVRAITSIAAGD